MWFLKFIYNRQIKKFKRARIKALKLLFDVRRIQDTLLALSNMKTVEKILLKNVEYLREAREEFERQNTPIFLPDLKKITRGELKEALKHLEA
jgi:hypothetical protein